MFSRHHYWLLGLFGVLFALQLYYLTWFVRHQEVYLQADVARDFFLYEELAQKKAVLIGPRSSTSGIFHGPTWTYLNFPAYWIGEGSPEVVGQYWVVLTLIFLASSFVLARWLFDLRVALVYTSLLAGNMLVHMGALYNPHGALFLIPAFVCSMLLYQRTSRWWWLGLHVGLAAMIIQFQMAVGIPLALLTGVLVLIHIWRHKLYAHLWMGSLLPLGLINYLVFELRHDFGLTKAIFDYASPTTDAGVFNYLSLVSNRLNWLIDLQLGGGTSMYMRGIIFSIVVYLGWQILKDARSHPYADALRLVSYYYFGYFGLTFVNKGAIINHQIFPLFAVSTLGFALLYQHSKKALVWSLFVMITLANLGAAQAYLSGYQTQILGQDQASWQFLAKIADDIAQASEGEAFGYYVYSPDVFAYSPRYALFQEFRRQESSAQEYHKDELTYVVAGPPVADRPGLSFDWWRETQVGITASPSAIIRYPNGYQVQEFKLSSEEASISHQPLIEVGIHFR